MYIVSFSCILLVFYLLQPNYSNSNDLCQLENVANIILLHYSVIIQSETIFFCVEKCKKLWAVADKKSNGDMTSWLVEFISSQPHPGIMKCSQRPMVAQLLAAFNMPTGLLSRSARCILFVFVF